MLTDDQEDDPQNHDDQGPQEEEDADSEPSAETVRANRRAAHDAPSQGLCRMEEEASQDGAGKDPPERSRPAHKRYSRTYSSTQADSTTCQ